MNQRQRDYGLERALDSTVPPDVKLEDYPSDDHKLVLALHALARHRGYPAQVHKVFVDEMLDMTREYIAEVKSGDSESQRT